MADWIEAQALPLESSELPVDAILNQTTTASSLLIALDFDGALRPLVERPEVMRAMGRFAAAPTAALVILSDDPLTCVQSRFDFNAIYAGSHGLEIAGPSISFVHPEATVLAPRLEHLCQALAAAVAPWPGAVVENRRLTAAVHIRACQVTERDRIRDAIRGVVRPVDDTFCLRLARAAFEICPRIGWDKASAVRYVERQLQMEDSATLFIGDDERDLTSGPVVRFSGADGIESWHPLDSMESARKLLCGISEMLEESPKRRSLYRFPRNGFSGPSEAFSSPP